MSCSVSSARVFRDILRMAVVQKRFCYRSFSDPKRGNNIGYYQPQALFFLRQFSSESTLPDNAVVPPNLPSCLSKRLVNPFRRNIRKKRPLTASYDEQISIGPNIVSLPLSASLDLANLLEDVRLSAVYQSTFIDENFDEGLYFVPKPQYIINENSIREFFVFADGVVVFWGLNSPERAQILRYLQRYAEDPYDPRLVQHEMDEIGFSFVNDGKMRIKAGELLLNNNLGSEGLTSNTSILERYAFSQGMAASVKVGIWETQLSKQADPLAVMTKCLRRGKILWRRKESLMKIGEFADLRHLINLNCNLLNTDFYWEREDLEVYYEMALRHFVVPRRLRLLNNRLDYCEDLVKMVDGLLIHRHESFLELMIILLIVVEVIFDIWHFCHSSPTRPVPHLEIDKVC